MNKVELAVAKLGDLLHVQQIGRATKPIHLWLILAIGIILGIAVSPTIGFVVTGVATIGTIWALVARIADGRPVDPSSVR